MATTDDAPTKVQWRKVRVGFGTPVSSCFTEMSWCQPGGILTCRKCIKAMRLPRWNGVLWGFSAGPLRCNTRPWHCFVGLHPKSECIIWNFYASMATTDGTLSLSQLWLLLTCLTIFSRRKKKQRTCWSIRAILHPIPHIGGKWGLGFRCLFHPVSLKCPDVNQGGILTCRKCIRAMRLPRWNGVLWGLSAGFLRCNTRPWHCFVGLHPKSECIIWNFYASMATTDGTLSLSQLWLLLTCLTIFSQGKNKQRTCWSIRAILHPIPHIGGSEGWVSDVCFILFHWNVLMSTRVEYSLAGSASEQWGSHDGMVFFEGSLLASCDATPGLGTAL